jgi:hypothetical protein
VTSVLTPAAPLSPNTDYTLTVSQEIRDLAGEALFAPVTITFTTAPPAPLPPPSTATFFHVTGSVTDDAGSPVAGATVSLTTLTSLAPTTRYTQTLLTSDSTGRFVADVPSVPESMNGPPGMSGAMAFAWADKNPYDGDAEYVFASGVSNLRLRLWRRREIAAGDSAIVVVSPDNPICLNNTQDMHPWPQEWVCATIHVMPAADGQLTITATPTEPGIAPPALESEPEDWTTQYFSISPTTGALTFPVQRGVPQRVEIEIPWGSSRSLSFVVKTSLTPH